jgi:tetratricopeptide (TPR) repeat protein
MPELRLKFKSEASVDGMRDPNGKKKKDVVLVFAQSDLQSIRNLVSAEGHHFDFRFRTFEKNDLRWYLEQYVRRAVGGFVHRATEVENNLRYLSKSLLPAALGDQAESILTELIGFPGHRYLTIESGSSAILALPWELAKFEGCSLAEQGVIIRRQSPTAIDPTQRDSESIKACATNMHILLVVSRPDEMGYFDHCRSARILDNIAATSSGKVVVDRCFPATIEQFEAMLAKADAAGNPYGIIHFDGHGAYNSIMRRGELCFEQPVIGKGAVSLAALPAKSLNKILRKYSPPALILLEACQTAQVTPPLMGDYSPILGTKRDLEAWAKSSALKPNFEDIIDLADAMSPDELRSNAAALTQQGFGAILHDRDLADIAVERSVVGAALEAGVSSVVGMSHSVHIDATAIFVRELYGSLANGSSIGEAVDTGRQAMRQTRLRRTPRSPNQEVGGIELADWFVPQLYQLDSDISLAKRGAAHPDSVRASPLIGRERELFQAERLLVQSPCLTIRGLAGVGKTVFVRELAFWISHSGMFPDGVFWLAPPSAPAEIEPLATSNTANGGVGQTTRIGPPDDWPALGQWLQRHRALLVIDAIESLLFCEEKQVPDGAFDSEFMEFVSLCSKTPDMPGRIMMTTRLGAENALSASGAETIVLHGLPDDKAAELLQLQLKLNGLDQTWHQLDAETRFDLLVRLAGNPGAIETAAANWPDSVGKLEPEDLDAQMAEWAKIGVEDRDRTDLGLAGLALDTLSEQTQQMLPLLTHLRGVVTHAHVRRLQSVTSEQWAEIIADWARIGLVEAIDGAPTPHRFHPWLPHRIAYLFPDQVYQQVEDAVASLYSDLFDEIAYLRPRLPEGNHLWLGAESENLRFRFARASDRKNRKQAFSAGLLILEQLAAAGLGDAELRWIRRLESVDPESRLDAIGLELRLRTCHWALSHRQRNDAVAIAVGTVIELDDKADEAEPALLARVRVGLADVLLSSGYPHAALKVYCRASADWMSLFDPADENQAPIAFHLAECLGKIGGSLANHGRLEQSWDFYRRQFMVLCTGIGNGNLSLEPVVSMARVLVALRNYVAAETLYSTTLGDTKLLSDRSLAAWFDGQGDLAAWQKRYDDAATMCQRALALYQQLNDEESQMICFRHMGAICINTGRHLEADSWLRAALDRAWESANARWASALIDLHRNLSRQRVQAMAFGGYPNEAKELSAEAQNYSLEQIAKLNGLKEYCKEADPWVRKALKLSDVEPLDDFPKDFDSAEEIMSWLRKGMEPKSDDAEDNPDQALDQRLTPVGQQAATACLIFLAMLQTQISQAASAET